MDGSSRRTFLAAGVSSVVAGLTGCSNRANVGRTGSEPATAADATTGTEGDRRARIAELEAELETLRTTAAEKEERIDALEAELERLRAQEDDTGDGSSTAAAGEFSEAVMRRARPVAKAARRAVVTIGGDDGGSGTAWFLEGGHLVTNSHVVDGQSAFECWTVDGESFEPTLLGASEYLDRPYEDVAVLETDVDPPTNCPSGDRVR